MKNKRILLLHETILGTYSLPGGGFDYDETKEQAFIREVKEETGFSCRITKYLGTITEYKYQTDFCQLSHCFIGEIIGEQGLQCLSENEEKCGMTVRWFSIDDAISILESDLHNCKDYKSKFAFKRDLLILKEAEMFIR